MNVLDYEIYFSKKQNETRLSFSEDMIGIVSGISPRARIAVLPHASQGDLFAYYLADALAIGERRSPVEISCDVARAFPFLFKEVLEQFPESYLPMASLVSIQFFGDSLYVYNIGDSVAIVELNNGDIEIIQDANKRKIRLTDNFEEDFVEEIYKKDDVKRCLLASNYYSDLFEDVDLLKSILNQELSLANVVKKIRKKNATKDICLALIEPN